MIKQLGFVNDEELRDRLLSAAAEDPDFWSFRGDSDRRHGHGVFQYPAMMVPQMQSLLITYLRATCERLKTVYDPFVGSGTVMTEAMLQGLDFCGGDINPLAVLLCRVKAGPFFTDALADRAIQIYARIRADRRRSIEAEFPGVEKWFRSDVAVKLSRVVRAIREESTSWSRRFFWVALAETVRRASNSRTSTVKLHIRPEAEIKSRPLDVYALFRQIVETNIEQMQEKYELLRQMNAVCRGKYLGQVVIELGDSSSPDTAFTVGQMDALITSPPYGDNVTTVTYGQHAYLPLQWIDRKDIDPAFDESLLLTTHEIDSRSLGGSRYEALESVRELRKRSNTFGSIMRRLADQPRDRRLRTAAFVRDLNRALPTILGRLRQNAYMIWVVGNRSVGGQIVPLNNILRELLESRGAIHVTSLERRIPSKRMALHNGISATMTRESILVMRKGGG